MASAVRSMQNLLGCEYPPVLPVLKNIEQTTIRLLRELGVTITEKQSHLIGEFISTLVFDPLQKEIFDINFTARYTMQKYGKTWSKLDRNRHLLDITHVLLFSQLHDCSHAIITNENLFMLRYESLFPFARFPALSSIERTRFMWVRNFIALYLHWTQSPHHSSNNNSNYITRIVVTALYPKTTRICFGKGDDHGSSIRRRGCASNGAALLIDRVKEIIRVETELYQPLSVSAATASASVFAVDRTTSTTTWMPRHGPHHDLFGLVAPTTPRFRYEQTLSARQNSGQYTPRLSSEEDDIDWDHFFE